MAHRKVCRPFVLLFLLLRADAIVTLAISPTNPVSLLNDTIIAPASTPLAGLISQNATSPSLSQNMIDYRIVGTPLVLRITETGQTLSQSSVNRVIDAAIRRIVGKINSGAGSKPIDGGKFWQSSSDIEVRLNAISDGQLTYFLLGDAIAGAWQYMNEPWSSFREIVFDIVLASKGWDYIGYGRFAKYGPFPPPPPSPSSSSLSRSTNPAPNDIE
ncbi:hypothetical protein HO133_010257 [Letharia lupina]|uniref:Uncharacterized protein n=1 Tax=Letharia lupina TaxID=560253 RepID=A0A8H6CK95_9LECA|nr:uncharacterized protein HO133_010257 [Letharia lupina]KAF6225062.1 hypothetical protein HO133_010257 [Letharia lupina]